MNQLHSRCVLPSEPHNAAPKVALASLLSEALPHFVDALREEVIDAPDDERLTENASAENLGRVLAFAYRARCVPTRSIDLGKVDADLGPVALTWAESALGAWLGFGSAGDLTALQVLELEEAMNGPFALRWRVQDGILTEVPTNLRIGRHYEVGLFRGETEEGYALSLMLPGSRSWLVFTNDEAA